MSSKLTIKQQTILTVAVDMACLAAIDALSFVRVDIAYFVRYFLVWPLALGALWLFLGAVLHSRSILTSLKNTPLWGRWTTAAYLALPIAVAAYGIISAFLDQDHTKQMLSVNLLAVFAASEVGQLIKLSWIE